MGIEQQIAAKRQAGKKMLAVLLDPENIALSAEEGKPTAAEWGKRLAEARPDFIFIGGSTYFQSVGPLIDALRPYTQDIPIVLFPGHPSQFSGKEDAVLFLSLISGNNLDTIFGWHRRCARLLKAAHAETISTGYILVDGGKQSTTARVTGTEALPADDINSIVDTAVAGEMLGLHAIYLEAGSGAAHPASQAIIQAVRDNIDGPLIVGGGIHTPDQLSAAYRAGADIVVIGNYLESHPDDLPLFCEARNNTTY